MRTLRDLFFGLLLLLAAASTVFGGIFLAYGENGRTLAQLLETTPITRTVTLAPVPTLPADTATARPSPVFTLALAPSAIFPLVSPSVTPTLTAAAITATTATPTSTTTATMTASPVRASPTPTFTVCAPPANWIAYTVKEGETMFRIGRRYALSAAALQQGNCLPSANLLAGQRIFVPLVILTLDVTETATPTITPPAAPLVLVRVELATVYLDPTRTNGAIAQLRVVVTGGAQPYKYFEGSTNYPYDVIPFKTECGATISGAIRVASADGQSATKPYIFYSLPCPNK